MTSRLNRISMPLLLALSVVAGPAAAEDQLRILTKKGSYEDVRDALKDAVVNRGLVIDYTGTSKQARGPINFTTNPGLLRIAFGRYLQSLDPDLEVNEGLLHNLDEWIAREGSILKPRFPAPLGMRGVTMMRNMSAMLGLLNVAKDAGLVDAFARLLRPLMRWLFPELPDGHPAQGAMLMNLSANMLGLDNAATPLGLKAMRELQDLNPVKDTATNSMAMFLAINTSSIVLIPFTIIGYRALSGSKNPAEPIAGTLLAVAGAGILLTG